MERIGLVCRWKPVHLGHAALLESLCERDAHVTIGIGSSNRRDARNPFSAEESASMIRSVLEPRFRNWELMSVPDLGDGPRWRRLVRGLMGPLDLFVTEDPWVAALLVDDYRVAHPATLVPRERHVAIDGTMVREAIARGSPEWRSLVPASVARLLDETGLAERFRSEFGAETLAGLP